MHGSAVTTEVGSVWRGRRAIVVHLGVPDVTGVSVCVRSRGVCVCVCVCVPDADGLQRREGLMWYLD